MQPQLPQNCVYLDRVLLFCILTEIRVKYENTREYFVQVEILMEKLFLVYLRR